MKKAFMIAAIIVFAPGGAFAQGSLPVERQDGTLGYGDLSDRELGEFTAGQLYLMNRRLSTFLPSFLMSMKEIEALPKDLADSMIALSFEQDKVLLRSTQPTFPNRAAREAYENFMRVPEQKKP